MIHSLSLTLDPSLVERAGSLLCDKCLYLEDQLEEKSVRIVHQIHGNTEKCHIKKSRAEVCAELNMNWCWLEAYTGIKEVMCEAFPHFSHPRSSR